MLSDQYSIMRLDDLKKKLLESGMYVFSTADASALMGKSKNYTSHMLGQSGHFGKIERGKYYLREKEDVFIVASRIIYPSYVTTRAAFRFYNLTTQLPKIVDVASTRRHKDVQFGGYLIRFKTLKKGLMFGYSEINGAFVASPEKAFLDSIYLDHSVYLLDEEFGYSLEKGRLDLNLLKNYATKMGNRNLVNLLGFFLEKRGMPSPELLSLRSHAYVLANKKGRRKDARWRVVW